VIAVRATETSRPYQQIKAAIEYFIEHQQQQPGLAELSEHVGLSEFHLQRMFSDWVGVSPKQFLKFLTKEYAKTRLQNESVLQAALDSGLSGAGRLHDLMISCEGVTPGEFKKQGEGVVIQYGFHESPFGHCMLAQTPRGVCSLVFFDAAGQKAEQVKMLQTQWPKAVCKEDPLATQNTIGKIFAGNESVGRGSTKRKKATLKLLLKGTPFQLKVWEALLSIPEGDIVSYQQVAGLIQAPSSVRAVASAVAKNNIGYLIPCHRVIRSSGDFSQYRWGASRKRIMLGWEASQHGNE